jgi:predicted transposase YbfD/YdcC
VIVADALHTQTGHARDVAARGAHLMIPAKANQPTPHNRLKSLPRNDIVIGDRTRAAVAKPRTLKAVTVRAPGGLGFPHAAQAIRITRTIAGKTTRETAYLIISLPAEDAQPADLSDWARREWHIENPLHWIRDVTFREDAHQARTDNGSAVAVVLRNTAIGHRRTNGEPNIAHTTRHADHRPNDLIAAVISNDPTTQ